MTFFPVVKRLFVLASFTLFASCASAQALGTAPEAETMVKKAVAYVKANGRDKAAQEFTSGTSFKDRDLYISYYQMDGTVIAHGANPKLVGKNLMELKDPKGTPFIQMITDVARTKGQGWSGVYVFRNPTTDKMQEKILYVEKLDDTWLGVGIYK